MKIFKKIDQNVWEDTSEDDNGIILANCIKLEGFDILIFCFNDRNNIQRIIFENTNNTHPPAIK